MTEIQLDTEKRILLAAKNVFVRKGFDGARMQEIADEAGINKALLHYYFRSKDKLFEAIFIEAFSGFIPKIAGLAIAETTFFEKVELIVHSYIDMLVANPHLPLFVLHEIQRNPENLVKMMSSMGVNPVLLGQIMSGISKDDSIRTIDFKHLLANILGMCIFPFIARPILQSLLFNQNKEEYDKYLIERKKIITEFVYNSLKL